MRQSLCERHCITRLLIQCASHSCCMSCRQSRQSPPCCYDLDGRWLHLKWGDVKQRPQKSTHLRVTEESRPDHRPLAPFPPCAWKTSLWMAKIKRPLAFYNSSSNLAKLFCVQMAQKPVYNSDERDVRFQTIIRISPTLIDKQPMSQKTSRRRTN